MFVSAPARPSAATAGLCTLVWEESRLPTDHFSMSPAPPPEMSRMSRDVTNVTKVVLSQRAPAADYRHGHSAHATPGTPTPSLVHHLVTRPPVQLSSMNVEACVPVHRCAEPAVSNLACAGRAAAPPHTCSVVERPGWCLAPAPSYLQSESRLCSQHSQHSTQQTYHHIVISSYHQSPGYTAAAVGNTANNLSRATLPPKICPSI